MALQDLIDRWNSDTGKPFKGSLIDYDAYTNDPTNPGCMCAQGQVLCDLGGYTPEELCEMEQKRADKETSRLLNISLPHAVLLRRINDRGDGMPAVVLTDPEKILGPNASIVLSFWRHIDNMTQEEWKSVADAYASADTSASAYAAAYAAASATASAYASAHASASASAAAYSHASAAASAAAYDYASASAAAYASLEIIGADVMRKCGHQLKFLPMFGFATPEEIMERD